MRTLTKAQFNDICSITRDEKNVVVPAKMQLHPTNVGIINNSKYAIKVFTHEDRVELTKINEEEEL